MQMFRGQFAPSVFFKVAVICINITLPLIYWISQLYKHEKPFPHCWISDCAGHYPEFVFFRISTISGSALIALGWMTNHFYLRSIAKEKAFNIAKYHPEISMILGIIGSMLLMGSTANIDTGKSDGKWHSFCASNFFVFTILAQIYNTVIFWIVSQKIQTVNKNNLYLKIFVLSLLIIQLIVALQDGIYAKEDFGIDQDAQNSTIGVILEWTLTVTLIAGFYSMGIDVEKFKFVYQMPSKQAQRREQSIDTVD